MNRVLARWVLLPLAALPAVVPLILILQFGVNFHSNDEWDPDIAGFFIKFYTHQAMFSDWFAQHNEHRPMVPRLCYLLLNTFTHWSNIPQLLATWVIVCETSLCVLRLALLTGRSAVWPWFVCNLLIFTPAQIENWMWGIGLANVLPTAFLLAGIVVALSPKPLLPRLITCLLLALAATYTDGDGMLTWPLFAAALLWSIRKNRRLVVRIGVAWAVACAIIVGGYFIHYVKPTTQGIEVYSSSPVAIGGYFLAFLGNAFVHGVSAPPVEVATIVGTIFLVLWVAMAGYFLHAVRAQNRDLQSRMFPWLLIGTYALLSGLLAAISRAGAGPLHAAMTSRYVSYSIYLPVSLVFLLPMAAEDLARCGAWGLKNGWRYFPAAGFAAVLLIQFFVLLGAAPAFRGESIRQREAKASLLLAKILPDNPDLASKVYANPRLLVAEASQLSDLGYLQPPLIGGADAQAIRGVELAAAPIVGRLDGAVIQGGTAQAVGWATVPQTGGLADAVFLTYEDGKGESIIFARARMGMQRTDLASKEGPGFLWSGWLAEFRLDRLPAQPKDLRITAWGLDADTGDAYPLDGAGLLPR
jgi:hypothetical protein